MKKVLILTYYWPPGGGAGVQRWLKFVKYLRRFGWEPVVYTPENPEAPFDDPSLLKDIPENLTVLKRKIREPYSLYKRFTGQSPTDKIQSGFLAESESSPGKQRLSVWIRGNLFIPDARKFWIRPSVKYLSRYLKENPVHCVVSSGPPHSLHLIGLGLKKKLHIPWLADFRDPWTEIDFYDKLLLTHAADRKHRRLEKEVVSGADAVVTINRQMKESFSRFREKGIHVIPNGYDPGDFPAEKNLPVEDFLVTHLGSINADRNPVAFWEAVSELVNTREEFRNKLKIKLIGKVDISVRESVKKYGLEEFVEICDPVPHEDVSKELGKSRLLMLTVNNTPHATGILTGKLYEYLASGRAILGIGPEEGEMAEVLAETGAGTMCGFNSPEKIKSSLIRYFNAPASLITRGTEKYSRIHLTGKLAEILDSLKKPV